MRSQLLHDILSQPSSPFREGHVIRLIQSTLSEGGVPHFQDPVGNIVVGAASKADYARLVRLRPEDKDEPLRIYIAHLDHPGFHGARWKSATQLEVKWHGGSPTTFLAGASVWLSDQKDFRGFGKVEEATLIASGRGIDRMVLEVSHEVHERFARNPTALFGGFSFRAPIWQEGDLIYTKAADDLVGAFSIVSLALDYFGSKKKARPPFLGLLTRAEEVGFIGAIGHFELGWLKVPKARPILGVSLETSRQLLPGAEIGKGPVVRLGDRYTVFDSGALRLFTELAEKALPQKHQRRIMDGGTCEATAATVYGIPCVGISVPLGNYHNQSFEGGPDSRGDLGPAPEFVSLSDVSGLLELCRALLKPKVPWSAPWKKRRGEFKTSLAKARPLLRSGP